MEDMFTPLHLRVGGSGRGGKSGREGRRQRGGGIRERQAEMTKVCIYSEVKEKRWNTERRLEETEEEAVNDKRKRIDASK